MTETASQPWTTLTQGDIAPDFNLPTDNGSPVLLNNLRGKQVVLYFYPKDDTPGCTIEAQEFSILAAEFEKAGAVVFGVSKDNVKSHAKFKAKYCLPFALISDDAQMCEAYGVWKQKSMMGKTFMGIERTTFLIGTDGKIRQIWHKVKPEGHAKAVLEALSARL